jgi:hypothetical protein
VAERDPSNPVERHRQRLLTRRLLGVIAILSAALVVFGARRWFP